jgi:diguanylate cyclase (GGDEF)-like protein
MLPISSEEMIRDYLRLVRRLTSADHASYFLPGSVPGDGATLLFHEGADSGIPELADRGVAQRFVSEQQPDGAPWVRSAAKNGWLVRVPCPRPILLAGLPGANGEDRRSAESGGVQDESPDAWLGLLLDGSRPFETILAALPALSAPEKADATPQWWSWTIGVGGALAWHRRTVSDLLEDPVSGLPGRSSVQPMVSQLMRTLAGQDRRATLILVNPDGFESVNKRLGHEAGDRGIREIADRLTGCTRRTDLPFRYGGAIFAVVLVGAGDAGVRKVVDKLSAALSTGDYLDGRLRLTFSFGIGSHSPAQQEDPSSAMLTLVRRADHALNTAKTLGGARAIFWQPGMEVTRNSQRDRLTGIFTADPARDYRNMLLLWETVRAVSSRIDDFRNLAPNVLKRLAHAFGATTVAIFEPGPGGGLEATVTHAEAPSDGDDIDNIPLDPLEDARQRGCFVEKILTGTDPERRSCSVPLMSGKTFVGALYLEGPADQFQIGPPDALFLEGLAGQLTRAIERSRHAATERERQASEQQRMRSELRELREALGRAKLVHVSASMDQLLDVARRAAVTDATVLISGESGTGKELIARTVHELSSRKDKPLVVVDCSSITSTLMESELFGHERGAYTGADRAGPGRLKEADGGTVLLDEVGELPLEVQSKLLRFVQEKQFTPVGGTRSVSVDVRLIAATNRDLAREVHAGGFRSDLYYRLKVVHLQVPPLRERPDDVRVLAQHFVRQLGMQYHKTVEGFTEEAKLALVRHDWPGNVRELRNRVLQAVVLSEDRLLTAESLGMGGPVVEDTIATVGGSPRAGTEWAGENPPTEPWEALLEILESQIDEITGGVPVHPVPLGKWVEHDLVLAAHAAAAGVASRGAEILGIPETTFRRRLRKATGKELSGQAVRPDGWEGVKKRVERLIDELDRSEEDLIEQARARIIGLLDRHLDGNVKLGAALMGVTEPTYRRWRSSVPDEAVAVAD